MTTLLTSSPWLVGARLPARKLRLYCFSYAGGGAHAYTPWQAELGSEIEVCAIQLPGRGARMGEQPMTSMRELVETLAGVIARQDRTPFAFFGHSLGGLVAFELARLCARRGLALPERLVVSGCAAPQHRKRSRQLHALPDDELIQALADYNGTPPEILAHRELMELLLPMIRADFGLAETYAYSAGPALPVDITVLTGDDDMHVSHATEWQKETEARCEVHRFPGDHFFINSQRSAVLACLRAELSALITSGQDALFERAA